MARHHCAHLGTNAKQLGGRSYANTVAGRVAGSILVTPLAKE